MKATSHNCMPTFTYPMNAALLKINWNTTTHKNALLEYLVRCAGRLCRGRVRRWPVAQAPVRGGAPQLAVVVCP